MDRLPQPVREVIASFVREPAGLRASSTTQRDAVNATATDIKVKEDVPIEMLRRLVDLFGRSIASARFPDPLLLPSHLRLLVDGCPGLTGLHFDHQMDDYLQTSLPMFARLQRLSFDRLDNIAPLASLTGLTSLSLKNSMRLYDLRPLSGLTKLTSLSLKNSMRLYDLRPLSGLTKLTSLALGCSNLEDIGPIASLSGLRSLSIPSSGLVDLRALSGLTELTHLDVLSCDNIASFVPLAGLTSLRRLGLSIRKDASSVISALTRLMSLHAVGTPRNLASCIALEELEVYSSRNLVVSELPVSLKKLVVCSGSSTPSGMAGISRLTSLTHLHIVETKLSDAKVANVAQLSTLTAIYFNSCLMSSIGALGRLSSLQELDINSTKVVDLAPLASAACLRKLDIKRSLVNSIRPLLALQGLRVLGLDSGKQYDGLEILSSEVEVVGDEGDVFDYE